MRSSDISDNRKSLINEYYLRPFGSFNPHLLVNVGRGRNFESMGEDPYQPTTFSLPLRIADRPSTSMGICRKKNKRKKNTKKKKKKLFQKKGNLSGFEKKRFKKGVRMKGSSRKSQVDYLSFKNDEKKMTLEIKVPIKCVSTRKRPRTAVPKREKKHRVKIGSKLGRRNHVDQQKTKKDSKKALNQRPGIRSVRVRRRVRKERVVVPHEFSIPIDLSKISRKKYSTQLDSCRDPLRLTRTVKKKRSKSSRLRNNRYLFDNRTTTTRSSRSRWRSSNMSRFWKSGKMKDRKRIRRYGKDSLGDQLSDLRRFYDKKTE